jgi:hypothetical protein
MALAEKDGGSSAGLRSGGINWFKYLQGANNPAIS